MKRTVIRILCVLVAAMCSFPFAAVALAAQGEQLYSVEFFWDKAGEDADNGYKAYMIEFGAQLKKPVDPQRFEKVFVGWKDWYTDELVEIEEQTMDNEKGRKFYAVWADEYYNATFYVDAKVFTQVTNAYGEAFIHPRLPEKDGYTFKGWNPELPQTTPAHDTEFYAVFEPNTYIATFLVDGEIYKQVKYTYGQKSVQLPKIPERPGYDAEWESYSLGIGGVEINAIYTPKYKINSVKVEPLKINYGSSGKLNVKVDADDEIKYEIYYLCSNPDIAEVDQCGNVTAKERGETSVICVVTDQYGNNMAGVADITVEFAWWQWIIFIFFLGFIWY